MFRLPRAGTTGLAALALIVVATVSGCGGGAAANADPGFTGHWGSSQWGEHYIRVEGSTVRMVYTHDDGRVLGTLAGDAVTGWWTESPSRQPSADAGEVTFTLTRTDQTRAIDGRWRYGPDGNLRDNWDLTWLGPDIPADIAAKFDETATFVQHP